jgi:hypothetical protein
MAISNLVTSPHCVAYVNSVPFARVCGLTYDIVSPRRELHGIDILEPTELVPSSLSIHGTIQVYRLHQDGGVEAAGLVATWQKLTKEKYASLMVLDRATDTVLVQVDKFCVNNQSWRITPKSFVLGTITWTGFGYSNDSD